MKLGYKDALTKGLVRLHIKNKANMNPDWLYASYHYSHPALVERITAIGYKGETIDIPDVDETDCKENSIVKNPEETNLKED